MTFVMIMIYATGVLALLTGLASVLILLSRWVIDTTHDQYAHVDSH